MTQQHWNAMRINDKNMQRTVLGHFQRVVVVDARGEQGLSLCPDRNSLQTATHHLAHCTPRRGMQPMAATYCCVRTRAHVWSPRVANSKFTLDGPLLRSMLALMLFMPASFSRIRHEPPRHKITPILSKNFPRKLTIDVFFATVRFRCFLHRQRCVPENWKGLI